MTTSDPAAGDDGRPARLDRELRDLAGRTVQRAFDVLPSRGALDLPVLFELIDEIHEGWRALETGQRAGLLERVMVDAVRGLSADVLVPDSAMSWRRLGQIIFDLGPFDDAVMHSVIVETADNRYNRLVTYARRESGFTKSNQTFSDRVAKLRQQIVVQLLSGTRTTTLLRYAPEAPAATVYVDNPVFDVLLRTLTAADPELVSLVGEPGIGKSRLVREVCARLLRAGDLVWLRAGDEHHLYADIAAFLEANGTPEVGPVLADAMRQFRQFLHRDSSPPAVVLDDVTDIRTVTALVGTSPRRPVIATSHAPLAEPVPTPLRGLRPSAATTLVGALVPELSRWEAGAIAAMTGGRPGLIHGIVTLLRNATGHLDVFDVWHSLQTSPSAVIELIEPVPANRISTFYATTMRQLRTHDEYTAATVELAAIHELDYTNPTIIATSLRLLQRINQNTAQAVVARTYAMLPRYGLVYPSRDPLVSALIREQCGPVAARAEELRTSLARDLHARYGSSNRGEVTDLVAGLTAVENYLSAATAIVFSGPFATEVFDEQGVRHRLAMTRMTPMDAVAAVDPQGERIRFVREFRFSDGRAVAMSVHVNGAEVQARLEPGAASWAMTYSGPVM